MALLQSTWLYMTLPWVYFTLLHSTFLYQGPTSLALHYSTMALLYSTSLYITLSWLYFTVLHSTLLYLVSILLHFTLLDSTLLYHGFILLDSTFYCTLAHDHVLDSVYITLPWLYFTLVDFTWFYHGSTSFYFILHFSTEALRHSTLLYHGST